MRYTSGQETSTARCSIAIVPVLPSADLSSSDLCVLQHTFNAPEIQIEQNIGNMNRQDMQTMAAIRQRQMINARRNVNMRDTSIDGYYTQAEAEQQGLIQGACPSIQLDEVRTNTSIARWPIRARYMCFAYPCLFCCFLVCVENSGSR